jgi:hypothetical protein
MSKQNDPLFSIADILDAQLETCDEKRIGRVADVQAYIREDGTIVLTHLVTGPQALAGRIAPRLRSLLQHLFHDRFDHCIPLDEVETFGPTLRLRGKASDYATGSSERWIARYILHWIPGSGHL